MLVEVTDLYINEWNEKSLWVKGTQQTDQNKATESTNTVHLLINGPINAGLGLVITMVGKADDLKSGLGQAWTAFIQTEYEPKMASLGLGLGLGLALAH